MATAEASEQAVEYDATTKEMGDKIVGMTLLEAKKLADYLENVHGIKPAAGGAVMMAGPAGDGSRCGRRANRIRRGPHRVWGQQDSGHQSRPRGDGPGPQRSQGTRGIRSEAHQGRHSQGRSREAQSRNRIRRRFRRGQVVRLVWGPAASKCVTSAADLNTFRSASEG